MPLYCSLIKCHKQFLIFIFAWYFFSYASIGNHFTNTYVLDGKNLQTDSDDENGGEERVGKPRCAFQRCFDVVPPPPSLSFTHTYKNTHTHTNIHTRLLYYISLYVFFTLFPITLFSEWYAPCPIASLWFVCASVHAFVCVCVWERQRKRLFGLIVAYFKKLSKKHVGA